MSCNVHILHAERPIAVPCSYRTGHRSVLYKALKHLVLTFAIRVCEVNLPLDEVVRGRNQPTSCSDVVDPRRKIGFGAESATLDNRSGIGLTMLEQLFKTKMPDRFAFGVGDLEDRIPFKCFGDFRFGHVDFNSISLAEVVEVVGDNVRKHFRRLLRVCLSSATPSLSSN